jgi:hypothetical protein
VSASLLRYIEEGCTKDEEEAVQSMIFSSYFFKILLSLFPKSLLFLLLLIDDLAAYKTK